MLADVTTAVTGTVSMLTTTAGSLVTLIVGQPVLLIGIGLSIAGAAFGLIRKFVKR